jgi:hypothetical protein
VVSKPQIRFKGKARADEKAQHTRSYVSILKRHATQPLDVRWGLKSLLTIYWCTSVEPRAGSCSWDVKRKRVALHPKLLSLNTARRSASGPSRGNRHDGLPDQICELCKQSFRQAFFCHAIRASLRTSLINQTHLCLNDKAFRLLRKEIRPDNDML